MRAVEAKGGVRLKLLAGPPGMKIEGLEVMWTVPADAPERADVVIEVTDATGQTRLHSFTLLVTRG